MQAEEEPREVPDDECPSCGRGLDPEEVARSLVVCTPCDDRLEVELRTYLAAVAVARDE